MTHDIEKKAAMIDGGDATDGPEARPPSGPEVPDAKAILRRLDGWSSGPARAPDSSGLPPTYPGALTELPSSGGDIPGEPTPDPEAEDANTNPEVATHRAPIGRSSDPGQSLPGVGVGSRPVPIPIGDAPRIAVPGGFDGAEDGPVDIGSAGIPEPGSAGPAISPAPGPSRMAARPMGRHDPSPTILIRDAFPSGLGGGTTVAGGGGEEESPGDGFGDSGRGGSSGEFPGSQHGVSAEDLLKTNELLRQLVEEMKGQRVASLPAAGPTVYPGR